MHHMHNALRSHTVGCIIHNTQSGVHCAEGPLCLEPTRDPRLRLRAPVRLHPMPSINSQQTSAHGQRLNPAR